MDSSLLEGMADQKRQELVSGLYSLQQEGQFCDTIILASGGEAFRAHSNVLATASPVLHTQLSRCPEGRYIVSTGMSVRVIQMSIEYMYTGCWPNDTINETDVSEALDWLGIGVHDIDSQSSDLQEQVNLNHISIRDSDIDHQTLLAIREHQKMQLNQSPMYRACDKTPQNMYKVKPHTSCENDPTAADEKNGEDQPGFHDIQISPDLMPDGEALSGNHHETEVDAHDGDAPMDLIDLPDDVTSAGYKSADQTDVMMPGGLKSTATDCPWCGRHFKWPSKLAVHARVHTGERPYQCSQCPKSFAQKQQMLTHQKIHVDVKPFQCRYCDKSFCLQQHMVLHERTHTGEKPHICDVCQKAFARPAQLYMHRLTHTGEKKHQCEFCMKRFTQRTHLVNHRRVHTGERPYSCQLCSSSFKQSSQLLRHIKSVHANT